MFCQDLGSVCHFKILLKMLNITKTLILFPRFSDNGMCKVHKELCVISIEIKFYVIVYLNDSGKWICVHGKQKCH